LLLWHGKEKISRNVVFIKKGNRLRLLLAAPEFITQLVGEFGSEPLRRSISPAVQHYVNWVRTCVVFEEVLCLRIAQAA
jgi:hypothetical protein